MLGGGAEAAATAAAVGAVAAATTETVQKRSCRLGKLSPKKEEKREKDLWPNFKSSVLF